MAQYEWRSQTRLLDEVAEALREKIYAGEYAPGAVLRQESIAADFGISRTPLREALRVLERDGLVTHQPGRGVRVATADLPNLIDAYAVREAMDGVAALFAARRASKADVARLQQHLEMQAKTIEPWDARAYTQSNVEFHMMIVEIAGNNALLPLLPLLRMTSQVFAPAFSMSSERAHDALREHQAIVVAIAAGDELAAENLARGHIRATTDKLKAAQQPNAHRMSASLANGQQEADQ